MLSTMNILMTALPEAREAKGYAALSVIVHRSQRCVCSNVLMPYLMSVCIFGPTTEKQEQQAEALMKLKCKSKQTRAAGLNVCDQCASLLPFFHRDCSC
jgi:hypothetical protein